MIVLLYHLCAFSTGIFPSLKSFRADKKLDKTSSFRMQTNYFFIKWLDNFLKSLYIFESFKQN